MRVPIRHSGNLTPSALDAIVKKVNEQEITNSKEIRKLRQILKDPGEKSIFFRRVEPSTPR